MKKKRWISIFMTVLLLIQMNAWDVFAAEGALEKEKNLKLERAEENAVVLKTDEGFQYAIEIVKEEKKSWSWAEEKQYDKVKKTVTFSNLESDTVYTFAGRKEGEDSVKESDICTFRTKSVSQNPTGQTDSGKTADTEKQMEKEEQKPVQKEQTETTETKKSDEKPAVPGGEEGKEEAETKGPEARDPEVQEPETENPEIKEPEVQEAIIEDPETKEPKTEDPEIKEPETENPEINEPKIKSLETIKNEIKKTETEKKENKESGKEAPDIKETGADGEESQLPVPEQKPVLAGRTAVSLEFRIPDDAKEEYKEGYAFMLTGLSGEIRKNEAGVFTGLEADSEYECALYIKAGTYKEKQYLTDGQPGEKIKVRTMKSSPKAPDKPAVISFTDTIVVLDAEENLEYAVSRKGTEDIVSYKWQESGEFKDLSPGTDYEFVCRTRKTEDTMAGEISEGVLVHTKAAAAPAPEIPVLAERTETSITLKREEGMEYALLSAEKTGQWQTSSVFSDLQQNTEYQFVARMAYNPEMAMESMISEPLKAKTVLSFEGCTVKGVSGNKEYVQGTSLRAEAVGKGLDNKTPSAGDTRWIPHGWRWDEKNSKKWEKEPYAVNFTLKTPGKYTFTVDFRLEEYTEAGWKSTDQTKSISVEFQVIPKTEYTIMASGGSGGRISPSGNIKVERGKDKEFTFIPEKGYQTGKVYVDGKETEVKNNRYTFKNVNDDHKISVTFVKAKAVAPKTGDETRTWPFKAALWISAGCMAGVFRRKKKYD